MYVQYRHAVGGQPKSRPYAALSLRLRLRLAGGSVPIATPDSLHSTCIKLQLSHATTSYPYPSSYREA